MGEDCKEKKKTPTLSGCVLKCLWRAWKVKAAGGGGCGGCRSSEKIQWENMRVSLGRTALRHAIPTARLGAGVGEGVVPTIGASAIPWDLLSYRLTHKTDTRQFFFCFQDRHGTRPDLWSTAAAKQQQQGLKHDITLESQKTNKQTNMALTFDLTPLASLDCFFMKSGLLLDFMISLTQKKGKAWC